MRCGYCGRINCEVHIPTPKEIPKEISPEMQIIIKKRKTRHNLYYQNNREILLKKSKDHYWSSKLLLFNYELGKN